MELSNFVKATIGVAIALIIVASVAIPIIGGFTESSDGISQENESSNTIGLIGIKPSTTIEYQRSTNEMTVNGESYDTSKFKLYSDNIMSESDGATSISFIIGNATPATAISFELTFDGSGISGSCNTTSGQRDVDVPASIVLMYYYDTMPMEDWMEPTQVYKTYKSGDAMYINADSRLLALIGSTGLIWGTYDDMTSYVYYDPSAVSVTIDVEPTDNQSLKITSYSKTPEIMSIMLYVPVTYYTELPVEAQVSGPAASMIEVIPILLMVGIVLATVAAFLTYKLKES